MKMGRNYFCEYCDKRMKCNFSIRKKHNEGLPHKIAKAKYMAQYRDPREILEEEKMKLPCIRFLNGKECKFDMFCHYSHYTPSQLEELKKMAERIATRTHTTKNYSDVKEEEVFPWNFPNEQVKYLNLPPSLLPYSIEKCSLQQCNTEWG